MAVFYPSKQIIFISLACIAIVGGALYSTRQDRQEVSSSKIDVESSSKEPMDSDAWKEQFIEAYVASSTKQVSSPSNLEENLNLTSTQVIARKFLAQLIQMQSAGLEDDQELLEQITDNLVDSGLESLRPSVRYNLTSLKIKSDYSNEDLFSYSETLINTLKTYMPAKDSGEAIIATKAIEQEDFKILTKIDPVISNYRKILTVLTSMSVPEPLALYHLELTNGISMALNNAQAFREMETDPVKGIAALSSTIESLEMIASSYQSIADYVTEKLSGLN